MSDTSKRPATANYTKRSDIGHSMTVEEYLECVDYRSFIDYDGDGSPEKDGLVDLTISIIPSERDTKIPLDATHIRWYNR